MSEQLSETISGLAHERNALIARLAAVEALAGVDALADMPPGDYRAGWSDALDAIRAALRPDAHTEGGRPMSAEVGVGSLWKRKPPGREEVLVQRVWQSGEETLVRAHPIHGGRPIVASVEVLADRYIEVPR